MTDPAQGPAYDPRYGAAYPYGGQGPVPVRRTNPLAVISLVAGLCGFTVIPVIGSIVAIITGHLALGQIRGTGEEGTTLAKAGLWIGYLTIGLGILAGAALLLFVVVASTTTS